MEFIFELLLELIFKGMIEGSTNKKVPMPIRIALGVLTAIFFLTISLGLIALGIIYTKRSAWSLLITTVGGYLLIAFIYKAYDFIKNGKKLEI